MGIALRQRLSFYRLFGFTLLMLGWWWGATAALAVPFFGDHARGWHWYEEFSLEEDVPYANGHAPQEAQAKRPRTPTEMVKAYREVLESRLHAAWVNPTPQNVQAYQEMQKDLMGRSKIFSTVWMQNVFQNPELDHTLAVPVNQQGRHLYLDLEKERTFRMIKGLSQTFGLFFFFAGDCPYCHQFAPIVKRFTQTYGWEAVAISVDGGSVAEFAKAEPDNGLFQAWGIKALPALFAVNPHTQEAIPIAYGLTSLDEMERRVAALVGRGPSAHRNREPGK